MAISVSSTHSLKSNLDKLEGLKDYEAKQSMHYT